MEFFLGCYEPSWLRRVSVPLFMSARSLRRRQSLPRATCDWALDSGAFSELSLHGKWVTTARQYLREVQTWSAVIGRMQWATVQDCMCEPVMLHKTGATVKQQQTRTLNSYLELMSLDGSIPWVPVLQGWEFWDYLDHVQMYEDAGTCLESLPLVGLGSVCRRQNTQMVETLIDHLHDLGIRLHGFGFKKSGLRHVHHLLASADSMAWSAETYRRPEIAEDYDNSANARLRHALHWRKQLLCSLTNNKE